MTALNVLYWHLDAASIWLKEHNISYRTVRDNNRHYIVTSDFKPARANLCVDFGVITEITFG